MALGHIWLEPERNAAMPYILEHELAHLRRQDSRSRLIGGTIGVLLASLCAGLLPLVEAAVALAGLGAAWVAYRWWGELACDRAAARHCGRQTALACWRQELDGERMIPLLPRLFFSFLALRSHPPTRLRLWLSRWAPPGL
ncbi:hypothetical protein ACWGI8_40080 [Streptomyces sp. NPDC054841]